MKLVLKIFPFLLWLFAPLFAQNNLTTVGSPSFGSAGCKFASCVTVSPGNVLTGTGAAAAFNGTNWSLDFWLKASVTGGTKIYFGTDKDASRSFAVWVGENAGTIQISLQMDSGGSLFLFNTGVAPSGAWQHVAVAVGGGTHLEAYVDGTRVVNVTNTYVSPLATSIGIGRFPATGSANDSNAVIDEVLIRNVDAFSGATITVPTSEYANSVANAVALYHLSNTADSAGAGAGLAAGTLSSSSITSSGATLSVATITGGTPAYSSTLQRAAFSGSCGTFTNVLTPQAGATPSWTDSGLTASTTYCYRVNTTDAASGSVTSNTVNVTTSAASLYTRYDSVGPRGGQAVMALVPGSASAVPYTGGPTDVVIYVHGAGENQEAWINSGGQLYPSNDKAGLVTAFINAGYILAGTNARGDNWGTQLSTDDYPDLYRYLFNNFNIRNVIIFGQSMGGLNAANVISQGKIPNIKGFLCIYCVFNLSNLHGLGGYTSAINTQHGVTGTGTATYANMTAGLDPLLVASAYVANYRFLPMRFYASPGDTVVPTAANTDAFQAATAAYAVESVKVTCTGNHGDPSHFQPSDALTFVQRSLARVSFALTGGVR